MFLSKQFIKLLNVKKYSKRIFGIHFRNTHINQRNLRLLFN